MHCKHLRIWIFVLYPIENNCVNFTAILNHRHFTIVMDQTSTEFYFGFCLGVPVFWYGVEVQTHFFRFVQNASTASHITHFAACHLMCGWFGQNHFNSNWNHYSMLVISNMKLFLFRWIDLVFLGFIFSVSLAFNLIDWTGLLKVAMIPASHGNFMQWI